MKTAISTLDKQIITTTDRLFIPVARLALFMVFFWFGFIKLIGLSPATPLAEALTGRTVGLAYFEPLFIILSLLECIIGLLFLVPRGRSSSYSAAFGSHYPRKFTFDTRSRFNLASTVRTNAGRPIHHQKPCRRGTRYWRSGKYKAVQLAE